MAVIAVFQMILLIFAARLMAFGAGYLVTVSIEFASINSWMIWSVDLSVPGEC
jgi:hypothetical protein